MANPVPKLVDMARVVEKRACSIFSGDEASLPRALTLCCGSGSWDECVPTRIDFHCLQAATAIPTNRYRGTILDREHRYAKDAIEHRKPGQRQAHAGCKRRRGAVSQQESTPVEIEDGDEGASQRTLHRATKRPCP